jgi:polyhydroxybutyrate depolymerase
MLPGDAKGGIGVRIDRTARRSSIGSGAWSNVVIGLVLAACTPSLATMPSAAPQILPSAGPTSAPASTETPATTVPTASAVVLPDHTAGCTAGVPPGGDRTVTVIAAGTGRSALVHVPQDGALGVARPLVLALHGAYDNPADLAAAIGLSAVADEHGFVVAYPAAAGETHTWGIRTADGIAADVAFISELIDRLGRELCLDPRRVYASGISAGGGMTKVLACRLDGRLAGIELVSAVYGPELGDCLPAHPVPTLAFAGLLDPLLPYYGGRIPIPLFADWPPVIGAEAFMTGWAANNGCTGDPVVGEVVGWAEPVIYQGCAAPTMLYRLGDAGHTWPGSPGEPGPFGWINHDVSASELLWSFFNED